MTESEKDAKASGAGHGDQRKDSVFDFLYHDTGRVESFLAQLDESGSGYMSGITLTESSASSKRRNSRMSAKGSIGVLEGKWERGKSPVEEESESSARTYDPLWINALSLLDHLYEHELLSRDDHSLRIGQFVLLSGTIRMVNMKVLAKVWDMPVFKRIVYGADDQPLNRAQRRSGARPSNQQSRPSDQDHTELGMSILKDMPHSVQAYMIDESGIDIWSNLSSTALVVPPDDIILKHGTRIDGTWRMLGIVDALPDAVSHHADNESFGGEFANAMLQMIPVARQLLGRPKNHYGVTPILIFREVNRS